MKDFNRNNSKIEVIEGRKVFSKRHQKLIFLKREEYFYDFFRRNQFIKTPDIYSIEGLNIKTYFIEGKEKNIPLAIKDWARTHNYFIENPLKKNKLLFQHDINKISKYLLKNEDISKTLGKDTMSKLKNVSLNKPLETLLHGDLTPKNFIFYKGGNYYFDFELGGIGHPARDIASLIISYPKEREKIIHYYKKYFNNHYLGFEKDLNNWTFVRASQLYFIFDKRKGDKKQKNKIKRKLKGIIDNLV